MRQPSSHRHHPGYKDAERCPACEANKELAALQRAAVEAFTAALVIDPKRLEPEERGRHKRLLNKTQKLLTELSGPGIVERLIKKHRRPPSDK